MHIYDSIWIERMLNTSGDNGDFKIKFMNPNSLSES